MRQMILWVAAGIILILVAFILVNRLGGPTPTVGEPLPTESPTVVPSNPPTAMSIIFPTSTDQLVVGQQYTLRWTGEGDTTQIFLIDTSLESQGQSVSIIDRKFNVPNTGSYIYTVPTTLGAGMYKFQIGDAVSDPFQVVGTATSNSQPFCTPSDVAASVGEEPAAGSIYGTLTLKNISARKCQIVGSNFVVPDFTAGNISVAKQGNPGKTTVVLAPNQEINSKFRYPNGPQCQSGVLVSQISFSYKISPKDTVKFLDKNGGSNQAINVCQAATETTQVQVWSIQ